MFENYDIHKSDEFILSHSRRRNNSAIGYDYVPQLVSAKFGKIQLTHSRFEKDNWWQCSIRSLLEHCDGMDHYQIFENEYRHKISENVSIVVKHFHTSYYNQIFWYSSHIEFSMSAEKDSEKIYLAALTVLDEKKNNYEKTLDWKEYAIAKNPKLSLETLLELYHKHFGKTVSEMVMESIPDIIKNAFENGQEDIRDKSREYFQNVLGLNFGKGW